MKQLKPPGFADSAFAEVFNSGKTSVNFRHQIARKTARDQSLVPKDGVLCRKAIFTEIAGYFTAEVANFVSRPAKTRLIYKLGIDACRDYQVLPWYEDDAVTLIATARPKEFEALRPWLEELFGPVRMAITFSEDIERVLGNHSPAALALRAEHRVDPAESCRNWTKMAIPRFAALAMLWLAAMSILAPSFVLITLACFAVVMLLTNSALKLAALVEELSNEHTFISRPCPNTPETKPMVSIIVPLYQEHQIAARLVERLAKLTYPKEKLEICLAVEADDDVTLAALRDGELPKNFQTITVPAGELRTKPRALNYALEFCQGQIIGVLDAEDAPAPDQIEHVVAHFERAAPEVACVQGVLDFYNARSNWLSRCFTLDYAGWFRVYLPGLAALGFVVPLGGTTVYFKRDALELVGCWDAHNVTEDADLGVRLARYGYKTELIPTVTQEEANCRLWPWVKQRSRWLKGYAVTWAVHMRQPVKLWRDLGAKRFWGLQIFFLGTLTHIALAPVLWSFWLIWFGLGHPILDTIPGNVILAVGAALIVFETTTFVIAAYGAKSTKHRKILPWLPCLLLYHPLSVIAIYKGFFELIARPFYWDKTSHGHFEEDETLTEDDGSLATR